MKIYVVLALLLYSAIPGALADTCSYKSKYEQKVGVNNAKSCECVTDESKYSGRMLNNGLKLVMVCDYQRLEGKGKPIDWGSFFYTGRAEIKVKISIGRSLAYDGPTPEPCLEQHYSIDSHDGKVWNIKFPEGTAYKILEFNRSFPEKYDKCEPSWSADAVIEATGLVVADYDADDAGSTLRDYKVKSVSDYRSVRPQSCI